MNLSGEKLRRVSFPVGGIGAGSIGINGQGRLMDWEIFNHPGKNLANGCSHFAVRAERGDEVLSARILHGDYEDDLTGKYHMIGDCPYRDYGTGPSAETLAGFPHFSQVELRGEFPVAEYRFLDPNFPAEVVLTAWSPFVPGESDISSLPVSLWEIRFHNTSSEPLSFTAAGVLGNPWENGASGNEVTQTGGLTSLRVGNHLPVDSVDYGELALTTDAKSVSYQEYWYRGGWQDYLEIYWKDFTTAGPLKNRHYEEEKKAPVPDHGMLAAKVEVAPGESASVRFAISWYMPNRSNTWDKLTNEDLRRDGLTANQWRNYYGTLCSGAADCAASIFAQYERLREQVWLFRDAIHGSTLPEAALAGAAENLAVLISPTCMRLEDGTFWGWEGVFTREGSCFGSCQHVWNYAQALSLLFPDLERSMRRSQALYGFDETGAWRFRIMLPLGRRYHDQWRSCVDGTFGEVMKIYREWKVSGDSEWLNSMWFAVKKAFEYTWSPDNPDQWDPEQTGVITGRQHHTLDMELFGPSGWLNGHYLGALKAAAEMAPYCQDEAFGAHCQELYQKGREWSDKNLFNGEYYVQRVDIHDAKVLKSYAERGDQQVVPGYWSEEHGEIKYQLADGCGIDAHLGQWYASLYGIGDVLDPEHMRSTLQSIYRYNYRPSMREIANPWRMYSLNDEAGTIMASWPDSACKPAIPLPYNSETMTGFEWAAAVHMVMVGEREKGERLAQAIRARFDGSNRNPWNEIECGSNYARSMAAYAMLQAYSGFEYDMVHRRIGFRPIVEGDFRCFWSLGKVWGTYEREHGVQRIRFLHGAERLGSVGMGGTAVRLNGEPVAGHGDGKDWSFDELLAVQAGDVLECGEK